MASLTQSIALKQTLKLTPQMIQTMGLIAKSTPELGEHIAKIAETNPALRIIDQKGESFEGLREKDMSSHRHELSDSAYKSYNPSGEALHNQMIEGFLSQAESLQDHLLMQFGLQQLSEKEHKVGTLLIQNLDTHGFHTEDPRKVVPESLHTYIPKVLAVIQRLDPVGTGVSDVRESLLVQAKELELSELAVMIIQDHLYDIHMGNLERSAKELKVPLDDLRLAIEEIQHLTPYPGTQFTRASTNYVAPDLEVIREGDTIRLHLRDDEIPTIELDSEFTSLQDVATHDATAQEYMKKQISEVEQLIQMISLRSESLFKVGAILLERQRAFFLYGKKHLVAITQKEIAQELGLSDSTVSRIANGKYIQTEWGLFPLKYFFSNTVVTSTSAGAPVLSRESIKEIIAEIIDQHDGAIQNGAKPKRLSDEKIKTALEAKGISVARRTVAKYRKELAIESSFDRQ